MANVLVIGGGGREHAIVWKLSQSCQVTKIYVAPGSYSINQIDKARNADVNVKNHEVKCCQFACNTFLIGRLGTG